MLNTPDSEPTRPNRLRRKMRAAAAIFEELGIDPLEEACKAIIEVGDRAKRAELWLKVTALVCPPTKIERPPETPAASVANAEIAYKYLKELNGQPTSGSHQPGV